MILPKGTIKKGFKNRLGLVKELQAKGLHTKGKRKELQARAKGENYRNKSWQ